MFIDLQKKFATHSTLICYLICATCYFQAEAFAGCMILKFSGNSSFVLILQNYIAAL